MRRIELTKKSKNKKKKNKKKKKKNHLLLRILPVISRYGSHLMIVIIFRAEKSDKCKMEFQQLSCSECKNGSIFRLLLKEERVPECMQFIPNHYEWLCCCCCC